MNRRECLYLLGAVSAAESMTSDFYQTNTSAEEAEVKSFGGQTNHSDRDNADQIIWSRSVPVRYNYDVVVIGGGIAGVSAACAAAKSGASVILIERFAVTGGMLTSGGVASFCGKNTEQGEVFDEIRKGLSAWNAYNEKTTIFNHEILAVVLQEMILRRKIKLLLHTRFVDIAQKDRKITEIIIAGKSGPEAIRGKVFIDTTGDGDVARAAGYAVMKGRPSDGLQLPMSLMYFIREIESKGPIKQVPEGWFHKIRRKEDLPMTSIWPNGPRGKAVKIKVPMFDSTNTESLTNAEIEARRRMMEVLAFYQETIRRNWYFCHCSPIIGIREGCRIIGDYILTSDDCRTGRMFDDAVALGTYELDGHKPDDDKRTYILGAQDRRVPPYQIPYRSLIARDGRNLLMAGRCFSADQLALSSARVSTSSSMMGQAAGIAAALAISRQGEVRKVDAAEIREEVIRRGASIKTSQLNTK